MDNTHDNHINLTLTVISTFGAIYHFIEANATKSNVSFTLGCAASMVAIIAGIMTIREKHYKIKSYKQNIEK